MKLRNHLGFALALAALCLVFQSAILAQCVSSIAGVLSVGALNQGTGIRTINVTVPSVGTGSGQVNQGTADAIQAALDAWNAQTSTTKVHFTSASSGGDISINMSDSAVASDGVYCASSHVGGNINFETYLNDLGASPSSTIGARTNAALLQRVFSHELGHVMNLNDQGSTANSIMAQGTSGSSNCADAVTNHYPTHYDSGITGTDASNAKSCANKTDVYDDGGGYGESPWNGECWDAYWVTDYYTMGDDGYWHYDGSTSVYLETDCGGPRF